MSRARKLLQLLALGSGFALCAAAPARAEFEVTDQFESTSAVDVVQCAFVAEEAVRAEIPAQYDLAGPFSGPQIPGTAFLCMFNFQTPHQAFEGQPGKPAKAAYILVSVAQPRPDAEYVGGTHYYALAIISDDKLFHKALKRVKMPSYLEHDLESSYTPPNSEFSVPWSRSEYASSAFTLPPEATPAAPVYMWHEGKHRTARLRFELRGLQLGFGEALVAPELNTDLDDWLYGAPRVSCGALRTTSDCVKTDLTAAAVMTGGEAGTIAVEEGTATNNNNNNNHDSD
jgi:hypothetical protein